MSTSPATVVRVVNEQRSSGQVTERVLHLSALNCVLAVFTFNIIVGFWIFHTSEDIGDAILSSLVALAHVGRHRRRRSACAVPALLRRLGNLSQDATVAFALAVILLVTITLHRAAVAGGRHPRLRPDRAPPPRRLQPGAAQLRRAGRTADGAAVRVRRLDCSTGATSSPAARWRLPWSACGWLTKTLGVAAFSHLSGISWRKGALTGLGAGAGVGVRDPAAGACAPARRARGRRTAARWPP